MDGLETRFAKAYLSCLPRTVYNTFETVPNFPVISPTPTPHSKHESDSNEPNSEGSNQPEPDGVIETIRGPDVKQTIDCTLDKFAVGHSMSTYSMGPKGTRLGEPICDQFCLKVLRSQRVAVCLTDGCGWGRNAKDASITTNETFIDYALENLEFARSLKQVAFLLLNSLFAAQTRLVQGSRSIDDVGTTTILGGLLLQVDIGDNEIDQLLTAYPSLPLPPAAPPRSKPTLSKPIFSTSAPVLLNPSSTSDASLAPKSIVSGGTPPPSFGSVLEKGNSLSTGLTSIGDSASTPVSSWCFMCVSLGDCKAYRYEAKNGYMHDITWSNRSISINATDPGGRLGPQALKRGLIDNRPDTRNLNIYFTFCDPNDVIIIASDGIHDNFDPEELGYTPREACDFIQSFPLCQFFISERLEKEKEGVDWEQLSTSTVAEIKRQFASMYMSQQITEQLRIRKEKGEDTSFLPGVIKDYFIRHCTDITHNSREFLQNNNEKLPKNYKLYPGKMDHTSVVCFYAGKGIDSVQSSKPPTPAQNLPTVSVATALRDLQLKDQTLSSSPLSASNQQWSLLNSTSADSLGKAHYAPHCLPLYPSLQDLLTYEIPVVRVLVTGASGLIGKAVVEHLRSKGHQVACLVRSRDPTVYVPAGRVSPSPPSSGLNSYVPPSFSTSSSASTSKLGSTPPFQFTGQVQIYWSPADRLIELEKLNLFSPHAVIHLSGENTLGVWNKGKKKEIRDSRIEGTKFLLQSLSSLSSPPELVLCASSVACYGSQGDVSLTEESPLEVDSFLAKVFRTTERVVMENTPFSTRTVLLRFGMVFSSSGGILSALTYPFRRGLGGVVGSGLQYMSWITLEDAVASIYYIMLHSSVHGPVNVTSPFPLQNQAFTTLMSNLTSRSSWLWLPEIVVKASRYIVGDVASELLLPSRKVIPQKLLDLGFSFKYPHLELILPSLVGPYLNSDGSGGGGGTQDGAGGNGSGGTTTVITTTTTTTTTTSVMGDDGLGGGSSLTNLENG